MTFDDVDSKWPYLYGIFQKSDIACEKVLFKFVTGHGARTYLNACKNNDKLIVWSMLVF